MRNGRLLVVVVDRFTRETVIVGTLPVSLNGVRMMTLKILISQERLIPLVLLDPRSHQRYVMHCIWFEILLWYV